MNFLILATLIKISLCSPYYFLGTLNFESIGSEPFDISGDNSILVKENFMNHTIIYHNINNMFVFQGYIDETDSQITSIDITDDGKWILVVEIDGDFHLMKYNKEDVSLDEFYIFTISSVESSQTATISDDH